MQSLKSICELSLGAYLSPQSVIAVLLLADLHNAVELKAKCIDYIGANAMEV